MSKRKLETSVSIQCSITSGKQGQHKEDALKLSDLMLDCALTLPLNLLSQALVSVPVPLLLSLIVSLIVGGMTGLGEVIKAK